MDVRAENPRHFAIVGGDGTKLAAYQLEPPVVSDPVPVVLQHGFAADSSSNWITPGIVAALTKAGRRVYLLDARGHGQSEKPHEPARYGHSQMATDVSALIDAVVARTDAAQVDFAGYSMGAWIGMHVVTTEPRIRRAVISGVGAPAGARSVERDPRDPVNRSAIATALEKYATDPTITIEDRGVRQFVMFAAASDSDLLAYAALMRAPDPAPVGVDRIGIPVLVLAGEQDDLAATAPELAAQIPGARMTWCPGTHLSVVGEPSFAAALVGFFAESEGT